MCNNDHIAIIDVLVPAYNAERTILDAIRSIQNQTITDIRIIVVNDGSTDGTIDIIRAVATEDRRILVVDQSNGGIVAARNRLINLSTAPYIAMHDADDISFPDRLERQIHFLDNNSDCVAVSGNGWHIDDCGRRSGGHSTFFGDVRPNPWAVPAIEPYLPQTFVMMRRDAVIAIGGYRERTNAEDTDLYWRLLSKGRLHNLGDIIGEIRMGNSSASSAAAANGRISAISSQLAAISRQRSLEGREDVNIPSDIYQKIGRVSTIREMVALSSKYLTLTETVYLQHSAAAKLLELASYRPYLLSADDCAAIQVALASLRKKAFTHERMLLVYRQAHVLQKLLRNRRWKEARALRASPLVYLSLLPALASRQVKAMLQRARPGPVD